MTGLVEWLAVDSLRGTRRRSLVHDVSEEARTRCGVPVPPFAWPVARLHTELLCRRCRRAALKEAGF